jgi:RecA-family ATPase
MEHTFHHQAIDNVGIIERDTTLEAQTYDDAVLLLNVQYKEWIQNQRGIYDDQEFPDSNDPSGFDFGSDQRDTILSGGNPYEEISSVILPVGNFLELTISPKQKILDPWINEQSMILISGDRGTGKTWFTVSIVNCITSYESFGPWETEHPVSCLYIDGELVSSDIQERFRTLGYPTTVGRKSPLYIYNDAYADSLGFPKAHMADPKWQEAMKHFLVEKKVKLVVFDNISSLTPGIDENSKKEWDPINQWLLSLRYVGITSVLLHHTGKDGSQRGTSGREDNVDISILLKKSGTGKGVKFITKFTKTRIPTGDLPLVREFEFTFDNMNGCGIWTHSEVGKKNYVQILKMLDQKVKQKDIASKLGVDASYVSHLKANAIKDGYLTQEGKFTELGKGYLASQ